MPWYAIAEFVDNSTQSFFNNQKLLQSISSKKNRPLTVKIDYDRDNDLLVIEDNAMGMSRNELERAMQIAIPPENADGRSKYGMGLKTASAWLGNLWTIRTKKYGETKEYTVNVDVEQVASGNNKLTVSEKINRPKSNHYTIIEIRKHNRKFYTRTLGKIGDFLSSMYREDFRKQILALIWQGKQLEWHEIDDDLLILRDHKKAYKKFSFSIKSENIEGNVVEKQVFGWAGVLKEGSRAKAGFSILHSGRVIKGWPDAWRPESLFGQIQGSNDLINQRLTGEIHLEGFDVSHTKDDILWFGDDEDQVQEELKTQCGTLREIARSYRRKRDDERGPSEAAVKTAIDRLKKELVSPEMADIVSNDPKLPEALVEQVVEAVKASVIGKFPETFSANISGFAVKGYVDEMSVNDPYLTIDSYDTSNVIVIVNASHPHWNQLKGSDGVLNYLRHCVYDAVAEAQARDRRSKSAKINPDTVKIYKDRLLRIPYEIEQNTDEDEDDDAENLSE